MALWQTKEIFSRAKYHELPVCDLYSVDLYRGPIQLRGADYINTAESKQISVDLTADPLTPRCSIHGPKSY